MELFRSLRDWFTSAPRANKSTKTTRRSTLNPELCEKCQDIFNHWFLRVMEFSSQPRYSRKHHCYRELQRSAERGCHACSLLLLELAHAVPSDEELKSTVEIICQLPGDPNIALISITFPNVPFEVNAHIEVLKASDTDHNKAIGCIAEKTDCEESWELAKSWLRRCVKNHKTCQTSIMDRKLPTRLIKVSDSDSDIRLSLSEHLPNTTEYLTLSHCWGNLKGTTLKTSNLEAMQKNIPLSILNKTFRDAITATRRLGYDYLWIDSFCICQDDHDDWSREAASMGNVYAGSSLNIAAADAPDGKTGCFFEREHLSQPASADPFRVLCYDKERSRSKSLWTCMPNEYAIKMLEQTQVNWRAWIFQERVLAPRTLYFAKFQMFWECRETMLCETIPDYTCLGGLLYPGLVLLWRRSGRTGLLVCWGNIVSSYSAKRITYNSDRMVALAGISKLFAETFGATYLGGLWEEDLVPQLVWFKGTTLSCRIGGPSWSWASVEGIVLFPLETQSLQFLQRVDLRISIQHASIDLAKESEPYGAVQSGKLSIRCTPPLSIAAALMSTNSKYFQVVINGERISGAIILPDTEPPGLDSELFCMPVYLPKDYTLDGVILRGLVLKRVGNNTFTRVACLNVLLSGHEKYEALENDPGAIRHVPLLPCVVDNDTGKCVIHLI